MRRFLSLFTVLLFCGIASLAQNRVVTGKVTDDAGNPAPFASIKIKNTKTGIAADANGAYSLKGVKDGDILEISGVGFKTKEVNIGTQTFISTVLEKTGGLTEVVVTSAFQTKRTQRSVASNAQNVNAEQLNTARQPNINNALAGKVAGVQVRSQSSAALGKETIVRLRGENGIGIGGGALYVVDGTIMPSANDINVDDIEDVTVLQGPAASALFGPEGANGAIVVNLKKAKKNQRNLGIEINSGVQFDNVYILPDYQNEYAGGNGEPSGANGGRDLRKFTYVAGMPAGWQALDGKYYPDYQEDESWGPRMVGQEYIPWYAWYPGTEYSYKTAKLTPQPNNARDFFNTGVAKQNNISMSKSGDNFSFRASYTNLDQKGIIPTSYLKRNTFSFAGSIDLSPKLTFGANINYVGQKSNTENDDGYANNTTGTFNNWFHRDLDINIVREFANYTTPEGILASWNHGNPDKWNAANPAAFYGAYYWFNPYSWQNNNSFPNTRDRLFGDISLTYKANNDLKFKFTYRKQQLTTNSEIIERDILARSVSSSLAGFNIFETVAGRSAAWNGYGIGYTTSNRQNYEFLTSYSKKIKDFAVNANVGADILKANASAFNANTLGGLVLPEVYLLSNSKNNINQSNTTTNSGRRALFARADVGFRNYLFVEGTFRRDYSSTEAYGFGINTKSAGVSFVFSDLIKNAVPFLSYGKLRASTGEILNSLTPYQNSSLYTINPQQFSGNFLVTELDRLVDPKLHGAVNTEKEIGIDLRFLKNRIGISATYWDRTNKNFPLNVGIYGGSGYSSISTNAGEVAKKGIDLQASITPIRNKNFDWTISATFGRTLKNTVVDIAPGIDRLTLQSGQAGLSAYLVSEVGKEWGQLRGIGFKRDAAGNKVIDANGLYVPANEVNFGSALPDFTGGVQNSITVFQNFQISINIDYSKGGKFFSTSQLYGSGTGLLAATAVLNDKGNSIRDAVADGGGVHVIGVDQTTGKPVDYYVPARAYFQQFSYGAGIAEPYIRDLTFVKVRELSIGYRIPVEKMNVGKYIKSANFSVLARNPWLIYSKSEGFDPSEISTESGEDGQLPGTRGFGVNLKLGF